MLYTAWIKSPSGLFWKKIRKIRGDTIASTAIEEPLVANGKVVGALKMPKHLPCRVLTLEDETRIEVPLDWAIKFSRERFLDIAKKTEADARGEKLVFHPDVKAP